jgi:hypothetical protein
MLTDRVEQLVMRRSGFQFPALKRWTDDYLRDKLQDQLISVAITPNG